MTRFVLGFLTFVSYANATGADTHPPAQDGCAAVRAVSTEGWRMVASPTIQFLVPPEYTEAEAHSIDSAVSAWEASDGRRIDSDLGIYRSHFLRASDLANRVVAVCTSGANGQWPQVVLYETAAGNRFAAGLYWPVPGGRVFAAPEGRVQIEALWMAASSADSTDLPELLAIIRTVRVSSPARAPA